MPNGSKRIMRSKSNLSNINDINKLEDRIKLYEVEVKDLELEISQLKNAIEFRNIDIKRSDEITQRQNENIKELSAECIELRDELAEYYNRLNDLTINYNESQLQLNEYRKFNEKLQHDLINVIPDDMITLQLETLKKSNELLKRQNENMESLIVDQSKIISSKVEDLTECKNKILLLNDENSRLLQQLQQIQQLQSKTSVVENPVVVPPLQLPHLQLPLQLGVKKKTLPLSKKKKKVKPKLKPPLKTPLKTKSQKKVV